MDNFFSDKIVAEYLDNKIPRRSFVKTGLGVLSALALAPFTKITKSFASPASFRRYGYVLQVKNSRAVNNYKVNESVLREMMQEGMMRLTGKSSSVEAWKTFFSPNDVVALKINPIAWMHKAVTHPALIYETINKLKEAGIHDNNIIIWDRFEPHLKDMGLKINHSSRGVRVMGTEFRNGSPEFILDRSVYYKASPASPELGDKSYYSGVMTKIATKVINMPVLKDHSHSGVTFCLKNLAFGVVNNTRRFHALACDPMIADVCSHAVVKSKVVLNIGDALISIYEGGPFLYNRRNRWMEKSVFFGTDMVAMDSIGLNIIEKKRKEQGLPSLWTKRDKPVHLKTSFDRGIGEYRLEKITHDIINH